MTNAVRLVRPTMRPGTLFWSLAIGVALLSGCGREGLSSVRGRVTIDGVPVTAGRIVFRNDATVLDGPIDPEGRYALSWRGRPRVPAGTYGVFLLPPPRGVDVDRTTGEVRALATSDAATHPIHLRTPEGSGVTRSIEAGDVTADVDFPGKAHTAP